MLLPKFIIIIHIRIIILRIHITILRIPIILCIRILFVLLFFAFVFNDFIWLCYNCQDLLHCWGFNAAATQRAPQLVEILVVESDSASGICDFGYV